jgi:hypothetical protein
MAWLVMNTSKSRRPHRPDGISHRPALQPILNRLLHA